MDTNDSTHHPTPGDAPTADGDTPDASDAPDAPTDPLIERMTAIVDMLAQRLRPDAADRSAEIPADVPRFEVR